MSINSNKPRMCCSARLHLAFLAMLGCVCFYSLRVNISFSIICMVNHTAISMSSAVIATNESENPSTMSSSPTLPSITDKSTSNFGPDTCSAVSINPAQRQDGELTWTKEQQGLVLGSTFWGYVLTNIAGGVAATRYGGKRVILGALFFAGVLTAVTPAAARSNLYIILVIRFLIGACLGTISPALQALFVQWIPPHESSMLRSLAFAGCQMGYILTFPASGLLCEYGFDGGWPSLFYIQASLVMMWCLPWTLMVTDSPLDHPHISSKERDYIADSLMGMVSLDRNKQSAKVPWNDAFRSRPVWACIFCHMCFNWGEYTFLTNIPTYLKEVLHFDVKSNGLLSALPYIGFWLIINISSHLADFCCRTKMMDKTKTRKLFNTVGMFIPAGFLVGMAFVDCTQPVAAVVFLTAGVSFTGFSYGGGLYIALSDISGRHAGVLYGVSNTLATIPGFVAPILIGHVTQNQTQEQWKWVFFLAAFIYLVGGSGFLLFGSGQLQPWAADTCEQTVDGRELHEHLTSDNSYNTAKEIKGESA